MNQHLSSYVMCASAECIEPVESGQLYCDKCRRSPRLNSKAWAIRHEMKAKEIERVVYPVLLYALRSGKFVKFGTCIEIGRMVSRMQVGNPLLLRIEVTLGCYADLEWKVLHHTRVERNGVGTWHHYGPVCRGVVGLMRGGDLEAVTGLCGG